MKNVPILLVEDNDDNRELMEMLLKVKGFTVTSVSTLIEARQAVFSEQYRLYILDWIFPESSGLDLCREIRQSDDHTPIVVCSVKARQEDKSEALQAGASAYLVKPDDTQHLAETVRRLLE